MREDRTVKSATITSTTLACALDMAVLEGLILLVRSYTLFLFTYLGISTSLATSHWQIDGTEQYYVMGLTYFRKSNWRNRLYWITVWWN